MCTKQCETSRHDDQKRAQEWTNPPSVSCLGLLPTIRLLKEGNVTTFLCCLLVALALLPLPFLSSLLNYLARFADFTSPLKPLGVGRGRCALARLFVFTQTLLGGPFAVAFRAAQLTVMDVSRVRHGWREAVVLLGECYDLL